MSYRTQRDVERLALPDGKREVFHFDAKVKGLSVRIQHVGKPAFVVWYTSAGKRKRVTLGSTAGMDLEKARRKANEITDAARQGRDPGHERKQGREAANGVLTLGGLVEKYLEHAAWKLRPGSLGETKRALERHWKPLHKLSAANVTRQLVGGRLLDLTRNVGPIAANRARANLSACYMWGIGVGLVDHNPTVGVFKNQETSRSRVLSIAELQAIWQATDDGPFSAIVRLLLLTGQRKGEVSGLAWHEINHERKLWCLPKERTKNKRPHEVPLSRQAYAILETFPQHERRPYIFSRYGLTPFSGWSQCKARLDDRIARAGERLAPWTLHDLRRTFTTLAADHELIEPHIIEAILNHASGHRGGVAGVYNRATYREPKKLALQCWADWLQTRLEKA